MKNQTRLKTAGTLFAYGAILATGGFLERGMAQSAAPQAKKGSLKQATPKAAGAKPMPERPGPVAQVNQTPIPAVPVAPAIPVRPKSLERLDVTPERTKRFVEERRIAILAAPSYEGSGLGRLDYSLADMFEMAAELRRQGYTVAFLGPKEATAEGMRAAIKRAGGELAESEEATLLVGFSGHGFEVGGKNYLVTYGVSREKVAEEAISLDELQELMTRTGAKRRLILADACRSRLGEAGKDSSTDAKMREFREAEGMAIFLGTAPGGTSWEVEDLKHGVFTFYVLEGLRGKAASTDGFVTLFDLRRYVMQNVSRYVYEKGKEQKPFLKGDVYGDFLLGVAKPPSAEEAVKPSGLHVVKTDTPVLRRATGRNQAPEAYFVHVEDKRLTLVRPGDLSVLAVLGEVAPEKGMDTRYRRFAGLAGDQDLLDLAVLEKGETVQVVQGRKGRLCSAEKACVKAESIPPLPGREQYKDRWDKVFKLGTFFKSVGERMRIMKAGSEMERTVIGMEVARDVVTNLQAMKHYEWQVFDLTAEGGPAR